MSSAEGHIDAIVEEFEVVVTVLDTGGGKLSTKIVENFLRRYFVVRRMAECLNITHKWKVFPGLWNIKNMAQLAASWKETGKPEMEGLPLPGRVLCWLFPIDMLQWQSVLLDLNS